MQEIEFLKHLVADAKRELEYIEKYQEEVKLAEKDNDRYAEVWRMHAPSRKRIKDDLRMILRVTIDLDRSL